MMLGLAVWSSGEGEAASRNRGLQPAAKRARPDQPVVAGPSLKPDHDNDNDYDYGERRGNGVRGVWAPPPG